MPAGRFYTREVSLEEGAKVPLPDAMAHQVRDVLRLAPGGTVYLLDGAGGEYPAELLAVERRQVLVWVRARHESHMEPGAHVVLCQGMLRAAKFEWVLQKCTELGVA